MTSPRPRVGDQIETAEELDALPEYTMVSDHMGDHYVKYGLHSGGYAWQEVGFNPAEARSSADMVKEVGGTFTVLHVPNFQPRTPEPAPATVEEAARVIHARIVDAAAFGQIDIEVHDLQPTLDFERSIAQALQARGMLRTPVTAAQARIEAEKRWPLPNITDPLPSDWHDKGMASGFVLGAQWATRVPVEGSQSNERV